jgi:hypothetical protein
MIAVNLAKASEGANCDSELVRGRAAH